MRTAALVLLCGRAALHAQGPFSAEKERALSEALAADLRREMPLLVNAVLDEYVQGVVQRLGVTAYTYELLDSSRKPDVTEPMPLPGGRILILSAFLLSVQDESEFAAMLAHAAGHLTAQPGWQALKSPGNPAVIPLLFPGSVHMDSRGRAAAVVLMPLAFRPIQDEREREADALALEVLTRAGYDISALRAYLTRTLKAGESATITRLTPLPERAVDASTVTTSAFTRAQDTLRALQPPVARRTPPTLHLVSR